MTPTWSGKPPVVADGGRTIRKAYQLRTKITIAALARKFRVAPGTIRRVQDGEWPRSWTLRPWQVSWIRRAARVRPHISQRAMMERFSISATSLANYQNMVSKRVRYDFVRRAMLEVRA